MYLFVVRALTDVWIQQLQQKKILILSSSDTKVNQSIPISQEHLMQQPVPLL